MARPRWVVFAYHTFGARALEALLGQGEDVAAVVTHEDDPAEEQWFPSVARIARAHALPVRTPASPNQPDLAAALRALEPDIVLSVWYRRLLGPELLAIPRVAALNVHGSLLPAYRGRAPLNWVLVNGESETGVTIHHMTAEADAGDIVAQTPIPIAPDDTAIVLYERLVGAGVDLLLKWYPEVLAGTAPRRPQDHARASVYGRRRPEDGRVSWTWPARRIVNMVRAVTQPFPGAFTGDGVDQLLLWEAEAVGGGGPESAGTVVDVLPGRGVIVAAGEGAVLLRRVQAAGRPEERADEWATRLGLEPGARC